MNTDSHYKITIVTIKIEIKIKLVWKSDKQNESMKSVFPKRDKRHLRNKCV